MNLCCLNNALVVEQKALWSGVKRVGLYLRWWLCREHGDLLAKLGDVGCECLEGFHDLLEHLIVPAHEGSLSI